MALDYGAGGPISVRMDGPYSGGGTSAKLTKITLPAANWKGGESPYSQEVNVEGVSVNSAVNLHPSTGEMELFHNQHIAFTSKNNGGIVTLYAIGDRPAADCVFQATISDVVNIGESNGGVIWGNTVCTPMVRTNWEQLDPTKADYLKGRDALEMLIQNTCKEAKNEAIGVANKAQTAADNAQTAADNAQTAADNAQIAANDAKTAADNALKDSKAYAKDYSDSKRLTFTATLTTNDWVGDDAPYTQTVGIAGILVTDSPHYSAVYDSDQETRLAQKEAFAMVDDLDTANGSVTFTCFEDKPEVNIPIHMEVNR